MSTFEKAITCKEGHVIFAEGEPSQFLYIVKSGEVGIFKEKNGRLFPISTIGPKDFIGELSMFSEGQRTASAIAMQETELCLVKKSDIRQVLKNCPDWVTNIMITIADRLRSTTILLREHRIADDMSQTGANLTTENLAQYWNSIQEYKHRKGLS